MIKNKFYKFFDIFWKYFFIIIIKINFHDFKVHFDFSLEKKKSILFIGNHFSWWDGFFIYHLNEKILKKRFNVMMLEEELSKRKFLTTTGAFSVRKNSKEIIKTISYSAEILNNPNNLLLMFPQGKIESMHKSEIKFERGVYKILEKTLKPIQIIFSVVMIDYLSNRKPTVNVYLKEFDVEKNKIIDLECVYNEWYKEVKEKLQ